LENGEVTAKDAVLNVRAEQGNFTAGAHRRE